MSNKNIECHKNLSKKQMLEKEKILLQMRKDINNLEKEIKYSSFINAKICALKDLKIVLRTGQLIAPYTVAAGIIIGLFTTLGKTPFYRDDHKQKLKMMKEFDSLGNYRYEQQYDDYKNSKNTLSYYSRWKAVGNNLYSRDVKIYSIENLTEEKIIEIINNKDNILSLEDVLGEPITNGTELVNNLSEEELQSESFLQILIFSENADDFIMIKESFSDNFLSTLWCILLTAIAELVIWNWRLKESDFDYRYYIEEIKRKHPPVDIDILTKKLEIRRNNYNRLMR